MTQGGGPGLERPAVAAPDLADREALVLRELAREGDGRVAFQGLRRRLELHQEALSRTLRRLEGRGLVARDDKGYKLTEEGFGALRGQPLQPPAREVLPLVQALLPVHLSSDAVAAHLARRWFRGLRWYGQAEGPGETTLTWLTESGNALVRVHIQGGAITLELERPRAGAHDFGAARGVLAALAELYGMGGPDEGPAGAFLDGPSFAA